MPSPWLAGLPQWNIQSQSQAPRQHPPPAPASSTYSPAPTSRSTALRPISGLFGRFTTPRLGGRPVEAPDVPAIPVDFTSQPEATTPWPSVPSQNHHDQLYEAGPGRRSSGHGSVVEDVHVPSPISGEAGEQEQLRERARGPGLQPPAPIHSSESQRNAANAAGDLPIFFSPSEIGDAHLPPMTTTTDQTAAPHRPQRHRRRHRRHHRRAHPQTLTHARNFSATSSNSLTKAPRKVIGPALRDPTIRLKLLHTLISGALFFLTLIVFLALNANPATPVFSSPFRVVNSLLIVFFAIIFVHSGILLGVKVSQHRRRMRRAARKNKLPGESVSGSVDMHNAGAGRRVQYFDDPEIGLPPPGEPIRVVLARDEDIGVNDDLVVEDEHVAVGVVHPGPSLSAESTDSEHAGRQAPRSSQGGARARAQTTPKLPPPVYGVWRGSVRADPNLLHWQRVEREGVAGNGSESDVEEVAHSRPPPSYVTQERRAGDGQVEGLQMLPATRYVI